MIFSVDVNDQKMLAPSIGGLQPEEEVGLPLGGDPVPRWDVAGLQDEEAGPLGEGKYKGQMLLSRLVHIWLFEILVSCIGRFSHRPFFSETFLLIP